MTRVVLEGTQRHRRALAPSEPAVLWRVIAAVGLAMTVVGWTDIGLLWYPLHFGSTEWEFGTVSAQLDGMPLGTLGLALLATGALAQGWRWPARGVAVACVLITLELVAVSLLYLLDVPVALKGAAPQVLGAIEKAMVKAAVFAVAYIVFYAWLAWLLWRKTCLVA
jgi:hypothetical protein